MSYLASIPATMDEAVATMKEAVAEILRLRDENERLRASLRFYANQAEPLAWEHDCDAQLIGPGVWDGGQGSLIPTDELVTDAGKRARAALKGTP